MGTQNIEIRAGENVYQRIMDGGFSLDSVNTFYAPASGPRFLVTSGFDIPLIAHKALGTKRIVWLIGASSGAWRMAAWQQPQPLLAYQRLIDSYTETPHTRQDTPLTTLASIRNVLDAFVDDDAISFALKGNNVRLAIITARARGVLAFENHPLQKLLLFTSFLANAYKREWLHKFFERVVFHSGVRPPPVCLRGDYKGSFVALNEENFKPALLASGAIPLVVPAQRNIYGGQSGAYLDGGLTDYHIAQNYAVNEEDVVLFPSHQKRIIPTWMDKRLKSRKPLKEHTANLLLVYPSIEFILRLPGGKVPDRDDFKHYINDNSTRIKRWKEAARLSRHLGEDFLEIIASGKIRDIIRKI